MDRKPTNLVLAILVLCGLVLLPDSAAHAVANGETVDDGEYTFAVKLTMTGIPTAEGGRRNSSCSGGLISPRWVLTAGHCFRDENDKHVSRPVARRTTATVGRADLRGDAGHVATVIAVRQSDTADVALAQLDRPITDIAPLRLNRTKPRVGDKVRLAGFGLLDGNATQEPTRMRTGRFRITSVRQDVVGLAGTAPRADTSPCPHDSGGPYFSEQKDGSAVVVAVVSHGPTCPHTGADLGGRIDTIARWITSVVGKDLKPSPSARPSKQGTPSAEAVAEPPPSEPVAGIGELNAYQVSVPAVALVAGMAGIAAVRRRRRPRGGAHRR
ncbi:trypsin-like serine protease [Actinoplanes sp. NPDC049548]|uniref:S1 family peptidase n=1 Tax=Actinoplanes sp. NPDC049548 TaxID=3155152 RepID=UPI00343D882E